MLDGKERERDDQGDGDHGGGEVRVDERQALDGREDRNRRRDHGVAVEQRGCEQRGHRNGRQQARAGRHPADQGKQREGAALASVVGAHGDQHVLHGDHQDQCPEDQGEHAHHVQRVHRQGVGADEAFTKRVEWAGADVAEHDAKGAQREAHVRTGSRNGVHCRGHDRSPNCPVRTASKEPLRYISVMVRCGVRSRAASVLLQRTVRRAVTASYCLHISVPFAAG